MCASRFARGEGSPRRCLNGGGSRNQFQTRLRLEILEDRAMLDGQGFDFASVARHVGNNPHCVTAADVDGDGVVDLITTNCNDDTVSVLRSLGGATFAPRADYAVGENPDGIAAADIDGDGATDLITTNLGGSSISVLRNLGDGTFAEYVTYAVGPTPKSVTAADVDGDGALDLITANAGKYPTYLGSISVLRNLGTERSRTRRLTRRRTIPRALRRWISTATARWN